jgi:hypothetical protein
MHAHRETRECAGAEAAVEIVRAAAAAAGPAGGDGGEVAGVVPQAARPRRATLAGPP